MAEIDISFSSTPLERLRARLPELLAQAARLREEMGIDDPIEALTHLLDAVPTGGGKHMPSNNVFEVRVTREMGVAIYNVVASNDMVARAIAKEMDEADYAEDTSVGAVRYCEVKFVLTLDTLEEGDLSHSGVFTDADLIRLKQIAIGARSLLRKDDATAEEETERHEQALANGKLFTNAVAYIPALVDEILLMRHIRIYPMTLRTTRTKADDVHTEGG